MSCSVIIIIIITITIIVIITGVCEKNTPPDKKTGLKFSFENTRSGA